MVEQKITRRNASQFFVAGELCRRGDVSTKLIKLLYFSS